MQHLYGWLNKLLLDILALHDFLFQVKIIPLAIKFRNLMKLMTTVKLIISNSFVQIDSIVILSF